MIDRFEGSGPDRCEDGLEALHRELSAVRIVERASFAPELEAELEAEHLRLLRERPRRMRASGLRTALVAGIGSILFVGLSVPPARGALVRLIAAVQDGATEVLVETGVEPAGAAPAEVAPPPRPEPASMAGGRVEAGLPPSGAAGEDAAEEAEMTPPRLVDRWVAESLVQRSYPRTLQHSGVGGVVHLVLWVDSLGRVGTVQRTGSSGNEALDRAAVRAAGLFRFEPARLRGQPVGTWVQFPIRYEPSRTPEAAPTDPPLPEVAPVADPAPPEVLEPDLTPEWERSLGDVRALLDEAVEPGDRDRLGSLDDLLSGEAPERALPLRWREEAADALEAAIERDPGNPAPFLALGRIRARQGLRTDARRLFERGIERAERSVATVPGRVVAELHYERGALIREEWLAWSGLGRVTRAALAASRCNRAAPGTARSTYASGEILIAWNYLCPASFDVVMRDRFESLEPLKEDERQAMFGAFYSAVEAFPGHPEANVEILLELADLGRWDEVLEGARRFARASGGHPHALLLVGMALHRTGRSARAEAQLEIALDALPAETADRIRDIRPLLDPDDVEQASGLPVERRAEAWERFWPPLDPVLSTPVNERRVEHWVRGGYALLRFGGPDTDAGGVWIRYGRPRAVRAVGEGSGLRTVFWDYGPGPDLTFRRPAVSLNLEQTPEAAAYLTELAGVFPHRYDAAEEAVVLQAQLARFRASAPPGADEVALHTRVPDELLGSEADSLELGIFLTGVSGDRWTVERSRVPPDGAPIRRTIPVRGDGNRLVVEVHDPATGRVAALRTPLAGESGRSGRPALSDVLLVEPAAPFSDHVRRGASWIHPRIRTGFPEKGRAGVVLEIYDLGESGAYRLQASLEPLEGGPRRSLLLKPAGELDFREAWERRRRSVGPTVTEYATLELGNVPAGAYLLRMTVTVEGVELEATRALEIG